MVGNAWEQAGRTFWYGYVIDEGEKVEMGRNGKKIVTKLYRVVVVGSVNGKMAVIGGLFGYKLRYGIPVRHKVGMTMITKEYQVYVRMDKDEVYLDGGLAAEVKEYLTAIKELVEENNGEPVLLPSTMPLVQAITQWLNRVQFTP